MECTTDTASDDKTVTATALGRPPQTSGWHLPCCHQWQHYQLQPKAAAATTRAVCVLCVARLHVRAVRAGWCGWQQWRRRQAAAAEVAAAEVAATEVVAAFSDGVWIYGQHGALPSQRPGALLVSDTMRNQCYLILSGDSSAIFPRVTRVITPSPESAFGS